MEIKSYINYIKEQLGEFSGKEDLKWIQVGSGRLLLENKKISLEFFTEYRSDDSIGITITDKKRKQYYTLFTIMKRKGCDDNSFMTQTELDTLNSIIDPIRKVIYMVSILIKKECQDIMSGDFSQVGDGDPDF